MDLKKVIINIALIYTFVIFQEFLKKDSCPKWLKYVFRLIFIFICLLAMIALGFYIIAIPEIGLAKRLLACLFELVIIFNFMGQIKKLLNK